MVQYGGWGVSDQAQLPMDNTPTGHLTQRDSFCALSFLSKKVFFTSSTSESRSPTRTLYCSWNRQQTWQSISSKQFLHHTFQVMLPAEGVCMVRGSSRSQRRTMWIRKTGDTRKQGSEVISPGLKRRTRLFVHRTPKLGNQKNSNNSCSWGQGTCSAPNTLTTG